MCSAESGNPYAWGCPVPEFQRPWLLLAPIVVAACWLLLRVGATRIARMSSLEGAPASRTVGAVAAHGAALCRWGTLAVLAAVAAGPFVHRQQPVAEGEGIAVVVALDVSESMREGRMGEADRLESALDELERFIVGRDADLIGLVTFAGRAESRVPPVTDRAVLLGTIDAIRGEEPGDGTALGSAVGVAANRLRAVEARSRVVIAITDGENNAGPLDPVTAAGAAAALGIRTYTIGVGDDAVAVLDEVAEAGGGRHFGVHDRAGLDAAYREIEELERSPIAESSRTIPEPRHASLLWVAVLLLAAEGSIRGSRFGTLT